MSMRILKGLFALFAVFSMVSLSAADPTFPPTTSFNYNGNLYNLTFTGAASRTAFFVKVYSVAHYLQDPTPGSKEQVFQQVFSDNKAKQFTFTWTYKADAKKIRDGFLESFHRDLNAASFQQYQNEINRFLDLYVTDMKPGDQQIIRWIPGGIIDIQANGQSKGQIISPDFAQILWGIWLGPKSALDRMALVSAIVR